MIITKNSFRSTQSLPFRSVRGRSKGFRANSLQFFKKSSGQFTAQTADLAVKRHWHGSVNPSGDLGNLKKITGLCDCSQGKLLAAYRRVQEERVHVFGDEARFLRGAPRQRRFLPKDGFSKSRRGVCLPKDIIGRRPSFGHGFRQYFSRPRRAPSSHPSTCQNAPFPHVSSSA